MLAHLGHPLVAMSTRLLRAAVSSTDIGLHRVTAVVSDDPALEDVLVGAYSRFVLVGADGVRLHEEVLYAGGWAARGRPFRRVENLSRSLRASSTGRSTRGTPAAPVIQARLAATGRGTETACSPPIERRTNDRLESLDSQAGRRQEDERRAIITSARPVRRDPAPGAGRERGGGRRAVQRGRGTRRRARRSPSTAGTGSPGRTSSTAWRPNATASSPRSPPATRDITAAQLPGRRGLRRAEPGGDPMSRTARRTSRGIGGAGRRTSTGSG